MERGEIIKHNYLKLILSSALIGLASSTLAYALKHMTEHVELIIYKNISNFNPILFIGLPTVGLTLIFFSRKYLFYGRKNKGIVEIYKTLDQRKEHLPIFKIPSHFLNGFLTVIFGGSTGVEVSTVVATATIGNTVYKNDFSANRYKRELVCAGVTAGVAVLFVSPLAGGLFAMEVIARKVRRSIVVSCAASALTAWLFIALFEHERLLSLSVQDWHWQALPWFAALSLLSGLLSVYFTLLVTRMKSIFGNINNNFLRVNIGAILVGSMIFMFPALYGDSYHGLKEISANPSISILTLAIIMLLKPLAASLTLGAGGDGGVFAPSIVAGAFLGLLFCSLCNTVAGTHLIPINFALVGAAATLSASIYAPFTALILVCNIVPNGYELFIPLALGCFIAKLFAQKILPYNAYTYDFYLAKSDNIAIESSENKF
ncbi:chloride channel protein [Hymenobacter rubripertinctus]|uniref:Chloride channel protein n=1 Tax=Hymenobacter rubripertinctus TaxID=2029981 RepID=A0A418QQG4_9BACT|nr:chloride channel protein [Hymenobacter rubripertinctus]RIY07383.1 chloride channel protein [Hymenobacter rubripertinctus]